MKHSQLRLFMWVMMALMALVAYVSLQERQLVDKVVLADDGVVLEYHHKAPVHIAYADIDKTHIACGGKGRSGHCGVVIFTKDDKKYRSKFMMGSDDAKALREIIQKTPHTP